jgi:hypothetical protein
LATKSLIAFTSESNLTVKTFELCPGFELGVAGALGVGASVFAQAAAKHETHTVAKPPETECKNFDRFIDFYF